MAALDRKKGIKMRLGISAASIGIQAKSAPDFAKWLINRAAAWGLSTVNVPLVKWQVPGYIQEIKDLLAAKNLEIIPNLVGANNYVATGDEAQRVIEDNIKYMDVCREVGAKIMWICCSSRQHNHFTCNPPVDEQIDRISESLTKIAQAAQERGIILALENHLDYRGCEIAQIVKNVNSPNLRVSLDTANAFPVFEEPVEAARILAPYTVTTHFKDFKVTPWARDSTGQEYTAVECTPLGKGNVDLPQIIEILWQNAPDPKNLPLNIELSFIPPDTDTDAWIEESIAYCCREFAKFLQ